MSNELPLRTVRIYFTVGMEWKVRADSDESATTEALRRYELGESDGVLSDSIERIEVLPLE